MQGHRAISRLLRVIRASWDELGIATALGHLVATGEGYSLRPQDGYIVEAIRRSRADLREADLDTIRDYVSSLEPDQLAGFVNNIKGIAHEVYYVEAENADGDTVHAYLFEHTNHPGYDVVIYDSSSEETDLLQLKATDSMDYVSDAVDDVGSDHVVVTEELAQRMGLQTSGISNEQLTMQVETFVDRIMDNRSLWDYVPVMSAWSLALIVASLARRYAQGELSRQKFLTMVAVLGGAKAIKIALIVAALSVPGLNVVAGALLFLKLAASVRDAYRT